ncbi:MAG: hypothetical protein K2M44_00035 [Clostridia bacterium]|nr:hypothetical protein [Clostridia bacterium]
MIKSKVKSYIGFAIKSGAIIWGLDNLLTHCDKARLIIYDTSLATTGVRKLDNLLSSCDIDCICLEQCCLLSELTGRDNVKLIAVTNADLADAIRKNINITGDGGIV